MGPQQGGRLRISLLLLRMQEALSPGRTWLHPGPQFSQGWHTNWIVVLSRKEAAEQLLGSYLEKEGCGWRRPGSKFWADLPSGMRKTSCALNRCIILGSHEILFLFLILQYGIVLFAMSFGRTAAVKQGDELKSPRILWCCPNGRDPMVCSCVPGDTHHFPWRLVTPRMLGSHALVHGQAGIMGLPPVTNENASPETELRRKWWNLYSFLFLLFLFK